MDIWSWVWSAKEELREQGQTRLAELIDELPAAVADDDIAKVDAIYPEALALAKNQTNPWVELFIRHWNLQSRVLRRDEGKTQLEEAIQLLDYSSQETTKECPQAICVVQDLASCYENIDPIGYANERLAVATETLERINPKWTCYGCITTEALNAKKSLGHHDEVLEDIAKARKAMIEADPEDNQTNFELIEAEVLSDNGQYDQALEVLKNVRHYGGGEHFERSRKMAMSAVHAKAGNYDKALEYLLPYRDIENAMTLGHEWCEVCFELAVHDKIDNNWRLHHYFEELCQRWLELGCIRYCFDHTVRQAKLAKQRKQKKSLEACVSRLRLLLPELRVDAGAAAELAALELSLQALPDLAIDSSSVDTLLDSLPEDIERRLSMIDTGLNQWPDNEALALAKIVALNLLDKDANTFSEQFLRAYPNSAEVMSEYGFGQPSIDFFTEMQSMDLTQDARLQLHWLMGSQYQGKGSFELALLEFQTILASEPEAKNTLAAAARTSVSLKEYSQAVDYWQKLIHIDEESDSAKWDLLVAATLAGDWSKVRKYADELGMEVEAGDAPIREQWSWARIAWKHDGETSNYQAIRTGPVTAQIVGSSDIGLEKTYQAEVVFDPIPLNRLDEEDEEGSAIDAQGYATYLYPMVGEIDGKKDKWLRYDLEGAYPGDELWQKLLDNLDALGIVLFVRSGDGYMLGSEKDLAAVYAYLMVPTEMSLAELNQHLLDHTASFEHPLSWPLVAHLSDDTSILERNNGITEKYAIEPNNYDEFDAALLS